MKGFFLYLLRLLPYVMVSVLLHQVGLNGGDWLYWVLFIVFMFAMVLHDVARDLR